MDSYKVRFLKPEDKLQHTQLIRYAFNRNASNYENMTEDKEFDLGNVLGVFDNNILVSTLQIIIYKQKIRGNFFLMAGISGVATKPEFRQKGLTKKLFDATFNYCIENDIPISVLYPFKYAFYEQFGYAWADNLIFITDYLTSIKTKPIPTHKLIEIIDPKEAIERIKTIYKKYLEQYNYLVDREATSRAFEKRLDNGFFFICQNELNNDVGYIVVRMEEKDNILLVREWIALDNTTRQAIWNFIAVHTDQRKFFRIPNYGPPVQTFYPYLKSPRVEKYDYVPNSMFRIIDIQKLLPNINYPEDITEHLEFQLRDKTCPWNERFWSLDIENQRGTLRALSSATSVVLDCKALAQFVVGFRSSEDLIASELLSGNSNEIKKLDKIFPKEFHLLRDFF